MKKIVVFLAVTLAAGTAAWAQPNLNNARDFLLDWDFNAVLTESVESRFSVQRFTSDVDDYIDPVVFNPEIGKFLFIGGYLNDGNVPTISLGYGQTLGSNYLGLFYGGSIITGSGDRDEDSEGKIKVTSAMGFNNNLAVLFGIADFGFRLDFIIRDNFNRTTYDGDLVSRSNPAGDISIALGAGTSLGDLSVWTRIGFKFPAIEVTTDSPGDAEPTLRMTDVKDSQLGILAGALYEWNNTNVASAELNYTVQFARRYSGDTSLLMGLDPHKEGGGFGLGLTAFYQKTLEWGRTSLRFSPRLALDFISVSQCASYSDAPVLPRANWFTVGAGIDAGLRYQFEKIGLYTGMSLDFIEYKNLGFSGGGSDHKTKDSFWSLSGIGWRDHLVGGSTQNPILQFGVTFAPIENLVIGAGFETNIGQFFNLNLRTMEISNVDTITAAEIPGASFANRFMLTVSYKF